MNPPVIKFLLIVTVLMMTGACSRKDADSEFSRLLKEHVRILEKEGEIRGVAFFNPDILIRVYDTLHEKARPKWRDRENIDRLLEAINGSRDHGLQPEDYHLHAIHDLIQTVSLLPEPNKEQVLLDMLLSDSFLTLASHLSGGKTDRHSGRPVWRASDGNTGTDWISLIDHALTGKKVHEVLRSMAPDNHGYMILQDALRKYLLIQQAGGWSTFVSDTSNFRSGTRHPDVATLRERLALEGFITHRGSSNYDNSDPEYFDEALREQVLLFQKSNGLAMDGIVGKATVEALNMSVVDKIVMIKVALERHRRNPADLGDHHIVVNIPGYSLAVVRNGKTMLTSKAIVGRPDRPTPEFSSAITGVELNPYWIVPPTMLSEDIIPAVRGNQGYLREKNMMVLDGEWNRVDPRSVEWRNRDGEFSYTIMQQPGYDNQLGNIKFLIPNPYHVVIHDTPYRYLFNRDVRAFSSGCIRIDIPLQLARYLLGDKEEEWGIRRILQNINRGRNLRISLNEPVDVHVLYLTTWADDDGTIHFRRDIYGHDRPVYEALHQSSPVGITRLDNTPDPACTASR